MKTRTQRGNGAMSLLWAIAIVVGVGAAAQLFGFDSIGLLGKAIDAAANGIQSAIDWVIENAQGRDAK
jgi:hypothetical protein